MTRVCFLCAVKAASDLSALPEGFVYLPDPQNGNGPTIRKTSLEYPWSDFLVRWLGSRMIGGSTWFLVLVLPVALEWEWGARAYRFLRRVQLAYSTRLQGPWSLRQFAELYPTVASTMLGPQQQPPEVMAGDEPGQLPGADYRPSDQDALADTEPGPTTIFT